MTYEQFEYQVISMLLAGGDPRLEEYRKQIWHLEAASRYETKSGFVTTFRMPSSLTKNGIRSKFYGLTIEVQNRGEADIELTAENGAISSLRGTFIGEINYADLLENFDQLYIQYQNGSSSDMHFYSGGTFEEVDEPIEKVVKLQVEEVKQPPIQEEPPLAKQGTITLGELMRQTTQESPDVTKLEQVLPQVEDRYQPQVTREMPDAVKLEQMLPKVEEVEDRYQRIEERLEKLSFEAEVAADAMETEKRNITRSVIILLCFIIGCIFGAIFMMLFLGVEIPFLSDFFQ